MPDTETTTSPEGVIIEAIKTLLAHRGATDVDVTPESRLVEDLSMDSLELAELSAVLEDELGRDPFSEGIVPESVAGLIAYYRG